MNPAKTNFVNRRLNIKYRYYLYVVHLYRYGNVKLLSFAVAVGCELHIVTPGIFC